jgi:hypothetical protein
MSNSTLGYLSPAGYEQDTQEGLIGPRQDIVNDTATTHHHQEQAA